MKVRVPALDKLRLPPLLTWQFSRPYNHTPSFPPLIVVWFDMALCKQPSSPPSIVGRFDMALCKQHYKLGYR